MVLDDPEFIDRVIREKLGFAKPSEKVFRFGK
jgi:cell division protein FtsB